VLNEPNPIPEAGLNSQAEANVAENAQLFCSSFAHFQLIHKFNDSQHGDLDNDGERAV